MSMNVYRYENLETEEGPKKEECLVSLFRQLVTGGHVNLGQKYAIETQSEYDEDNEVIKYNMSIEDIVDIPQPKVAYFCDGKACEKCGQKELGSAAVCLRTLDIRHARNFEYNPSDDFAAEIVPGIDITDKAIKHYGNKKQIEMAIEEMAELIVAINHGRRGRNLQGIIEEIADVEIMLMQLKTIFSCWGQVDLIKDVKLERLSKRMEEEGEN